MAWYAELRRRKWYCINRINMIQEYRKMLYDKWYNSLTEEQKIRLEERKKEHQKEIDRQFYTSLRDFANLFGAVAGVYGRTNRDKYHGLYDENGFARRNL